VRSGIGPQERLAALEIATQADLPVGTSYRDHCGVGFTVSLKPRHQVADVDAQPMMSCALRYSSGLAGGGHNDMNIFALNLSGGSRAAASAGFVKVSVFEAFSDGEVRVVSRHPLAQPQIEMNLLADERDRVRLRDGVRRLTELLRTSAFGLIAEGIHTAGDTVFDHASESSFSLDDADDDDKLDAWLRQAVTDTAHGVGTCPIGRVVDDECRVYGIDRLWLADASVMPAVPRVNTMLPTLIVAERVASCMRQRGPEPLQAVT
jgi:choline dehydrogenase